MLLVRGNTRKQAAAALTVSLNTIKSHTKNIYRKLGSHNRAILYQYARRMGVDPLTWQEN